MANKKPWMTSDDIIASVKRRILFPLSQNTFSTTDVLAFANEEMMISQVPSVLEFHEEYFVFLRNVPLVTNISKYAIPDRAIGMRLRDLMWSDPYGNLFEMTRISADDKAFFQQNIGSNMAIAKYYLQGNEAVLTPAVVANPTGHLNFSIYLRPNQLVANSRAAIIQNFVKDITVDNSLLTVGDFISVVLGQNDSVTINEQLTSSQRTIVSNSIANPTVITTTAALDFDVAETFQVVISEVSGSTPSINGTYTATVTGANTFTIPVNVTVAGTGGYYAFENEFTIGSTSVQTAANLASCVNNTFDDVTASNDSTSTCTLDYSDITLETTTTETNSGAIVIDEDNLYVNFNQLDPTWTDPETNETTALYVVGEDVDFLQTKPGHRTYNYDVELLEIDGTIGKFAKIDLQYYAPIGATSVLEFDPIQIGDYICLANECIIPQIPPDLHTALAERTAARILAAIGDQQGLDRVNTKIQEIEGRQGTLLDSRVDGSSEKITARKSLLHFGKFYGRGRW